MEMMAALTQLLAGLTDINFNMLVCSNYGCTHTTFFTSQEHSAWNVIMLNSIVFLDRIVDSASLEFGAAPEAINQVQPALRLRVADMVSTPSEGIPVHT